MGVERVEVLVVVIEVFVMEVVEEKFEVGSASSGKRSGYLSRFSRAISWSASLGSVSKGGGRRCLSVLQ
jgi:hypothetical protein